jgi:hypothetical protein
MTGRWCLRHAAERDRWVYADPATVTRVVNALVGCPFVQIGTPARTAVEAAARRGQAWRGLVRQQIAAIADACRAGRGCSNHPTEEAL